MEITFDPDIFWRLQTDDDASRLLEKYWDVDVTNEK